MNLKKAVFPVAGFGTRFLPATKAMPKELLPIVYSVTIIYTLNFLGSLGSVETSGTPAVSTA